MFSDIITVQLRDPGNLEEYYPITKVFEKKKKIFKFFCKLRTNNIHEFEGCFLRGQLSSNGYTVFNSCMVEP